ncbi:MAG TPA: hypothetical protein VKH15_00350 [Candidatus Acidoferrum sp.]|nr:hypothetical protein [Candidatus Acidoferrum sp.]
MTGKATGGMDMKHFTTEEWVDFVNQITSGGQQQAMQKHLATGCKQCTKTVSLWQKVCTNAAVVTGESYQPPADTVRLAKALYLTNRLNTKALERQPSLIEVLFDSFLQPAVAGARSAVTGTRQMLYRADPYQVDIQIEAKPEGSRLVVTGQLLDVSRPDILGREVQVTLSNHRGMVVHMVTNQFGEFRGEIENTGDLEISFPGQHEKPIVISLRNALGKLAEDKA